MNHRIVITEYPKSGGTWIASLIGDALGLPKRDIYVTDAYKSFDVRRHPWYLEASDLSIPDACVVKSHEHPGSNLLNFATRIVHLVRDGRDVVVSKYFYERDFCVANGIYRQFDESFDEYEHNTFVRVGVSGDWRTHFRDCHIATFDRAAGEAMARLGYH